jgi:hypothetical protein
MQPVVERTVSRLETILQGEFPNVPMEFTVQEFTNHAELWIYVLNLDAYERVRERCRQISEQEKLDKQDPEIWLLVKSWTGPWPGGQSEQDLRTRRDAFRRKHGMKLTT